MVVITRDAPIVVAGGQESISAATHWVHLRQIMKMGTTGLIDTMMLEGPTGTSSAHAMNVRANNVARKLDIDQKAQNARAFDSQRVTADARNFQVEITSVTAETRKETPLVDPDDHLHPSSNAKPSAKLRQGLDVDCRVIGGNSSGLNDGVAAVVLIRENDASRRSLKPRARTAECLLQVTSGR